MDYSDLECPYCGAGLEVNHDDGRGYDEDTAHKMTCTECKKSFVFHTTIIYDYNAYKADCLNGFEHTWMLTKTFPREVSQMCCAICDEHRELTESERNQHDIGMLAYFQTLQKVCQMEKHYFDAGEKRVRNNFIQQNLFKEIPTLIFNK